MDYAEFNYRKEQNQWEGYTYNARDGEYTVLRRCQNDPQWWVAVADNKEVTLHKSWLEDDAVRQVWKERDALRHETR